MIRDLSDLRSDLDQIDREIIALFERRMEVSRQVAAYKREKGLPILDAVREEQVLQSRAEMLKDASLTQPCRELFTELMRLSRKEQEQDRGIKQ